MFLNKKREKKIKIFRYFLYFILLVASLFLLLLFLNFINIKYAYEEALSGKRNLEYSFSLFKEKKFNAALDFSLIAQKNFQKSLEYNQKIKNNIIIKHFYYLNNQIENIDYLFSVANILSQSFTAGIRFSSSLDNIINSESNFSNLEEKQKEALIKRIYESSPELNGLKADLDLALINLDKINYNWPISIFQNKIEDLKTKIKKTDKILKSVVPMSELLPFVLGYPQKTSLLVILQNKDELRPTGGFIGTYGILELEHGEILRFDTHDIYHLDMPVKDKLNIKPPKPLEDYLGIKKWYMRDANWSPDWPSSAKNIEDFYWKEDRLLPLKNKINNFDGKFAGAIAITPDFIIDLLKITGPIIIDGEEYNQYNFTNLLQYKVEKGYELLGTPSWERKEVIGKIATEIKKRLFAFDSNKFYKLLNVLKNNLDEKNILIYFKDDNLEEIVSENNWGGKIKNNEGDYLMVVDANLAAFKTDRVIDRKINYKIMESKNGIFSDLFLFYKHNGQFDWKTTRYRTYVRIYTPLGSELVKAEGFSQDKIDTYSEFNKTVFGGFISIEPGKIGNIYLRYKLPNSIDLSLKKGYYTLYVQKQAGKEVGSLEVNLDFIRDINSYLPTGFYVNKNKNNIKWESDFFRDKKFIVNF